MRCVTVENGDILESKADILVCPVNCVPGVMGAGLAKAFADHDWPERFVMLRLTHDMLCRNGGLRPGKCPLVQVGKGRYVCLMPTKTDWRRPSTLELVRLGLDGLRREIEILGRPDGVVGLPAIGCGLGGLRWPEVAPIIEVWATGLPPGWKVELYPPREGG